MFKFLLIAVPVISLSACGDQDSSSSDATIAFQNNTKQQLNDFYKTHGGKDAFSVNHQLVIETMLEVEDELGRGETAKARNKLKLIWKKFPIGTDSWYRLGKKPSGLNIGTPAVYYALRMLQQIVDDADTVAGAPDEKELIMAIFLAACAKGPVPKTTQELVDKTGVIEQRKIDPRILKDNYSVLRQTLSLWQSYVHSASDGRLRMRLEFIELPKDFCMPTEASGTPYQVISTGSMLPFYAKIDKNLRYDWSWIIYPSMLPKDFSGFENKAFITGGMGRNPFGGPLLIGNDAWLFEKPPHLGHGVLTEVERRVYLPQWLQHEHFHHFFQRWPEFGLEKTSHQWFTCSTWPTDFVGKNEPDYFAEALNKRLKTATPPIYIQLRYAPADPKLLSKLTMDDFIGPYRAVNYTNNWHAGVIELVNGTYRWRNEAGVKWVLEDDIKNALLIGDRANPNSGKNFKVKLVMNEEGDYLPIVSGLFIAERVFTRQ